MNQELIECYQKEISNFNKKINQEKQTNAELERETPVFIYEGVNPRSSLRSG